MNTGDRFTESDLDRLLENGLPPADAERLRRQLASESRQLEREIRDRLAGHGQGAPGIARAPASLRARLRAIPGAGAPGFRTRLRWGLASALAGMLIALLAVYRLPPRVDTPTTAEVERARTELVIAFSYLQQVSSRSGDYMKREIGHTMQEALNNGIFYGLAGKLRGG